MESYQLFRNCRNALFQACAFSILQCPNCKTINLQFLTTQAAATLFLTINEKKTNVKQLLLIETNADYVMETSGNGKHGIVENDQETIQSNQSSPANNAGDMQSSSDEESDL